MILIFEFVRWSVSEGLVNSLCVVESVDVLEDVRSCLSDVAEGIKIRRLVFERSEEAFHDGVVAAVYSETH